MDKMSLYLIIVLAPLFGSLLAGFCGKKIGKTGAHTVTILGLLLSTSLSCYVLKGFITGQETVFNENLYTWLTVGDSLSFSIGFLVDQLTALMMFVVTSVSLMVHIYTIGYMKDDSGYQRFFSYISLFTFSMLVLLMSNNFVQLFFGWEAVGLVSYLLIGFWFKRPTAIFANLKAFLINRVGDFGFLLGIGLVLAYFNVGLEYSAVFQVAPSLKDTTLTIIPGLELNLMTTTCILLFIGAMGKSAQFPLHVWLPDSMEGPTPISALIHAATMVTAGIFMVTRMSPLFELSTMALTFIVVIGAITALFMGFLGVVQHDIKRVVAYSTLSQLGYMIVALGVSAYSAGMFHVMTHAFFKALLFLCAGSVIIGMHHDQDMRNMGGLRRYMPITWITMLLGSLSLIGTPFFSGFFSKDSIIEAVKFSHLPVANMAYWFLVISVFITAFYSFRLYFLVFHGKERWRESKGHHVDANAEHHGLAPNENPKESPWSMILPLIFLAIPSVIIGYYTIEPLLYGGFFGESIYINTTLHTVMASMSEHFEGGAKVMGIHGFTSLPFWLALAGVVSAFIMYMVIPALPEKFKTVFKPIYALLDNKYYIDDLYYFVFVKGSQKIGRFFWQVGDVLLIDSVIVNGSARVVSVCSVVFRKLQTGFIYTYAVTMILGLLVFIIYWFYPVILKTFS
ncbi:MAG: NADH-quinone oxidoreductase subunit L [Neisseriaceae bacterium]|nr:MAG: NADH-quinone oxidoreductase subunit L [Neisseriaceae bacterium]